MMRGFPHGQVAVEHIDHLNCREWLADPPQRFKHRRSDWIACGVLQFDPEILVYSSIILWCHRRARLSRSPGRVTSDSRIVFGVRER